MKERMRKSERKKTKEKNDKEYTRKQYLFLNTHHYAMMEKQEKKKIPASTMNNSKSLIEP